MNALGRKILRILEYSPMGPMSIHFLNKQCDQANIDLEKISHSDIQRLADRMSNILPFFIGKNTDSVVEKITRLKDENNE